MYHVPRPIWFDCGNKIKFMWRTDYCDIFALGGHENPWLNNVTFGLIHNYTLSWREWPQQVRNVIELSICFHVCRFWAICNQFFLTILCMSSRQCLSCVFTISTTCHPQSILCCLRQKWLAHRHFLMAICCTISSFFVLPFFTRHSFSRITSASIDSFITFWTFPL